MRSESQSSGLAYGSNFAIGGHLGGIAVGLSVVVNRQFVGGVGLSSGRLAQDTECARVGIDFYEVARLKDGSGRA
jgi:uncharacterized protein GlcG (DUF336 family)